MNITSFLPKTSHSLHQFGKKVLPGKFLGFALFAGENLERETLWLQTYEDLDNLGAQEIHARRLTAKEVITPKKMVNML